jgi:hypothetical protein
MWTTKIAEFYVEKRAQKLTVREIVVVIRVKPTKMIAEKDIADWD